MSTVDNSKKRAVYNRPKRPCTWPGCHVLIHGGGRCEEHARKERKQLDAQRGTAQQRGYTWDWHKARTAFLADHPLCVACSKQGLVNAAQVVDHIIPHKGDSDLFWDDRNWQALCKRCHDSKTAQEDGRWN